MQLVAIFFGVVDREILGERSVEAFLASYLFIYLVIYSWILGGLLEVLEIGTCKLGAPCCDTSLIVCPFGMWLN